MPMTTCTCVNLVQWIDTYSVRQNSIVSIFDTVDSRYNTPGYNAVPDKTLIISGPRSNKNKYESRYNTVRL